MACGPSNIRRESALIVLLSPAKTLDFQPLTESVEATKPTFLREANELIGTLRDYSPAQIKKLMNVSDALAEKTFEQYRSWKKKYNAIGTKPAVFAYQGDVYGGLQAERLSDDDLNFAQERLRILSGLYGMLKPLDLIQPYRLEMGTKVKHDGRKDLYQYWGETLTRRLKRLLNDCPHRVIVNLASAEYSNAIDMKKLNARIITPSFKEEKDGSLRFLSFFGKAARGMMAGYIIRNQVENPEGLKAFDVEGYRWNSEVSKEDQPVFSRPQVVAQAG